MENVVTKGAKSAEAMDKVSPSVVPGQSITDLGGPTPENYTNEPDGSAKLNDAGGPLKKVEDVVTKGAKKSEGMEKASPEPPAGGTTDARSASSQAEKVTTKPPGQTTKEEIEVEEEEVLISEIDIEEDVTALLSGEELSEDFQNKARTIFEAAIRNKVAIAKEELQEAYETRLVEELELVRESVASRVDAYLEYVADEWMAENAIAVEHGLRTEMTESFISGMKQLFDNHYVSIPEERFDVVESMVEKLDEMEEKLNEQIERNITLNSRLGQTVAEGIFIEVSEGLAETQKDKLIALAKNVEFDSEAGYREKLESLKESYFPGRPSTIASRNSVEDLTEEVNVGGEVREVTGSMAAYLQTLDRVSKK